jgi:hypothetical protein
LPVASYTGLAALDVTWWYFISKFVDFFDSFFFVLRKKFSHLSTLHVVHHGCLPLFVWLGESLEKKKGKSNQWPDTEG